MDEVVLDPGVRASLFFAQQPDFGSEASVSPVVRRGHADRREARRPRWLSPIPPGDASPSRSRQVRGELAHGDRSDERDHAPSRAGTASAIGLGGDDAGTSREHRQMRRVPHGIGQSESMQCGPKRGDIAEFGIGEHRRHGEARRARVLSRAQRHPLFGKVQRGAQAPRARAGPEGGGHGDLAIRHLAERSTVLTRHTDRRRPLFGKARAVENQHASSFGEHGTQAPPDAIRVPERMGDEVLKGLVRHGLGDPRQHGLHRLPLAVAEDALDVRPQRQHLSTMAKAALELLQPSDQSLYARGRRRIDHRAEA